ncbi:MAG TPA: pitrilysin family protein, partial [Phycisphaerae bacterium]|nr:pitrilysin family protein [Phycisphaerae bacterium]
DLLGDILRPSLRQTDFDTEKGVILEEIAMYDDMPHFRVYDNLMADHFSGHPLGNSILGTKESIKALKRDQMQHYFDRRYSPTNVTLVAVGRIDFDALVKKAEEICGGWKPFDAPRSVTPCDGSRSRKIIVDAKLARENMGFMSPAPSFMSEERFAADVLAGILGDATGSRLYYALIETGLADEASCQYSCMDGSGALMTFISCDPQNAQKVADITSNEYRKFLADGPSEAELAAAKNKFATGATLKGELPMGRLTAVGFDWVYRGEYIPLHDQIQKLLDVTCKDVVALAKECEIDNPTALVLGPTEKMELFE